MSSGKYAEAETDAGLGAILLAGLGIATGFGIIASVVGAAAITSGVSSAIELRNTSRKSYNSSGHLREAEKEAQLKRQQREYEEQLRREFLEEEKRVREQERLRREEEERLRKIEEERRRMISQACKNTKQMLQREINSIKNDLEREQLQSSLKAIETSYRSALNNNDTVKAEEIVNTLRQKIISVQADEQVLDLQRQEFQRTLTRFEADVPKNFIEEFEHIRNNADFGQLSIEEQSKKITSLMTRAYNLVSEIRLISVDDLEEEILFIPPVVKANNDNERTSSILHDICSFGSRIEFYDETEAQKLKPLICEAKNGTELPRMKLIRSQVKTVYGRLREEAVLTAMFKRDIRDFMPPMKRARGTEMLCQRMEDLLTAPIISRDDYNSVYKEVKVVLMEQLDYIAEAVFAEKIGETLSGLGYTLLDENGNPANLTPGQVRMIDAPYEGYRVRVKVGQNNTVVTRLVRVVGSEDEKRSVSEYQLQQDIETGQKWCKDVQNFYDALKEDGITMTVKFSKEPGEEPLDVVVDESVKKTVQRGKSAERQADGLHIRKIGG